MKVTQSSINRRLPQVHVLIICPTRELAIQVAAEANVLLKHHDGIGVQTLIGGTRFKMDQKRLESNPCQVHHVTGGLTHGYLYIQVEDSIARVDPSIKEAAYHAWLGYYNSIREVGRDKTMLADLANQFCHSIGLEKPPALFRRTALKMGLKGIPGIRVQK
ncbi:hypothetical protein B296_00041585 [Ensete ventricosum]|uniref:DEAD/DEAH-box helicase domain-containing protein n=1 Tax=Ensete ventricosum TaxID=4639 RepID=A0A426ZHA0_ENSVE|nr:hypothetical protein B296_00041585 [Ensete ventricosum]